MITTFCSPAVEVDNDGSRKFVLIADYLASVLTTRLDLRYDAFHSVGVVQ